MKNFTYCLLKSTKDAEEALSLVKREYIKQGYLDPNNPDCKIDIPKRSAVFSAKFGDRIIGTISAVLDSEAGLPMDSIYKKEVDKLRLQNKKVAEVCRLAIDNDFLSKEKLIKNGFNNLFLLPSLFRLAFYYCDQKDIDNICIAINPKHDLFYKSMSFKKIGKLKYFSAVNNAPAVARTLDIKNFKQNKIKNYLLNNLLATFWQRTLLVSVCFSNFFI